MLDMGTEKQLFILRHGKSDWSVNADDFSRPLKKRGMNEAVKVGQWLTVQEQIPEVIISSPAHRAFSTASIVATQLDGKPVEQDERIYEADTEALLSVISDIPSTISNAMMVGHNPGLDALLLYLAPVPQKHYQGYKLLTTATLAIVKVGNSWSNLVAGQGQLLDLIRGKSL